MRRSFLIITLTLAALLVGTSSFGYPSLYTSRCASCHSDDTTSCNGCHNHHYTVNASADQPTYEPGAMVTVTVNGGDEYGWIRGLLYDQDGQEIDRAAGPTGTGDDGLGNPVTFPVTLQAAAPALPGTYTWQAGWYGGANQGGGTHLEDLKDVTFTVEGISSVPDEPRDTWDKVKTLYR